MRITGGENRGRVLKAPPGKAVRPTSDMVRQALFNILAGRITGASVLDLFAGTGSLGLEALSRGATRAAFVEKDRRVAAIIRENLAMVGAADRCIVRSFDALSKVEPLRQLGGPFDIVFLDPPYRLMEAIAPGSGVGALLEALWTESIVAPGSGLVVLQHDKRSPMSEAWMSFQISDRRTYGDTALSFMTSKEPR